MTYDYWLLDHSQKQLEWYRQYSTVQYNIIYYFLFKGGLWNEFVMNKKKIKNVIITIIYFLNRFLIFDILLAMTLKYVR